MCLLSVTWSELKPAKFRNKVIWQTGYKVFRYSQEYENNDPTKPYDNYNFTHQGCKTKWELDTILKAKNKKATYLGVDEEREWQRKKKKYPRLKHPQMDEIIRYDREDWNYIVGFHIFTVPISAQLYISTESLRHYKMFEVKYRKVNAIGTHTVLTMYPVDCVVAQEMKIIKPIAWLPDPGVLRTGNY